MLKEYGINQEKMMQGIADALAGKTKDIDQDQANEILQQFQAEQQGKAAQRGARIKEDNDSFLAENAKKPGVITTKSGLQYEILATGKGKTPKSGDHIVCNYKGELRDGTVFDESEKHGGPATFTVGQLIAGWNEALVMMKEGDKWKLTVPADLAYGDKGPPSIGPNQILIFEMELVQVQDDHAGHNH
jgi:FKBP-type peptidyl-prolyl cis-trans isomerase